MSANGVSPSDDQRRCSSSCIEDIEFFRLEDDVSDLPSSLIVTNIHSSVFASAEGQSEFEHLFSAFDTRMKFEYFRSFRRVRITFSSPQSATQARLHTDMLQFKGQPIRCFFAQTAVPSTSAMNFQHLSLPPLEKQFLISPPCSPPVGWEQSEEAAPVINHDLLARLAAHAEPDTVHELQPEMDGSPAIIVHPCVDDSALEGDPPAAPPLRGIKIQQTRCPARV